MEKLSRAAANGGVGVEGTNLSKKVGWVAYVVLDENDPLAKADKVGSQSIGQIRYSQTSNLSIPPEQLPKAYPFDKIFNSLPIKNEQVEIYEGEQGNFYYRRIGTDDNPTQTAFINANAKNFSPELDATQTTTSYKNTAETKIVNTNQDASKAPGDYGKYYQPQLGIHRLKLYEGDTLIESRFGQSIRFSAYNNTAGGNDEQGNPKPAFAPTLIIRNVEASENNKKDRGVSVEEDVNRDGSIIAMTSGQHQLGFTPGTVDDKGKSDFKTQPDSFGDLPKLIGDQMLLSSGRIILSSKNAETLIYSKKNFGIVSDGAVSIDTKLGMDISVGDDINIVTTDRDVNIVSGKGSIFLGSEDLEAMVKGKKLVELLNELLQAILDQQYLTPSGPSAIGPVNKATFASIQSKLDGVLSKLNQTA
jgi:uncharacterized protein (DUF2345 family)